jgi:hypothetical protein
MLRCLQRLCLYGITVRSQTISRSNDSLSVWLSIGPVTLLDKEVSLIALFRTNDAIQNVMY